MLDDTGYKMPTPGKSEESDQILFVNWVHRTYPDAWPFLHHSPNGKRRSASDGQKLKLMGVRAGFPDLFLPWPVGDYMGCVIELKLGKGRATAEQKKWIDHFVKCGYAARVLTLSEAQIFFSEYMNGDIG